MQKDSIKLNYDTEKELSVREESSALKTHIGEHYKVTCANGEALEDATFDMITEHFDYGENEVYAKQIEDLYFSAYERSKDIVVSPMEIENEKVLIEPGMVFHRASLGGIDIDGLRGIAELGIIASEWFGQHEIEREGICCAFFNTIRDESSGDPYDKGQNLKNLSLLSKGVNLFVDRENPVMRDLLRLDYFQYLRDESDGTPLEIKKIFNRFIIPNSPGMNKEKLLGTKPLTNEFKSWKAILGGVPPQLINGIEVNVLNHDGSKDEDVLSKIDDLKRMFPQSTIFDTNRNVLRKPE